MYMSDMTIEVDVGVLVSLSTYRWGTRHPLIQEKEWV